MDPNSNQSINTQQTKQVTPTPVQSNPVPTPPSPIPQAPKSGGKKVIALLIILIIFALGMWGYIIFVKNRINNQQKRSAENTSVIIPTITPTPTPASVEEIDVASPDADLNNIEKDIQGL